MNQQPHAPDVSLAELVAALSRAADLALGYPIERSLRICLLGMHFGAALGMTTTQLSDLYYAVLLRWVGCSILAVGADPMQATTPPPATSDDHWYAVELLRLLCDVLNEGEQPIAVSRFVREVIATCNTREVRAMAPRCAVAQRMARRLGLRTQLIEVLGQVFERSDGQGSAGVLDGDALPLIVQVIHITTDAEFFFRLSRTDGAIAVIQYGAGRTYDPVLAAHFCRRAPQLLPLLSADSVWQAVLAIAPGIQSKLSSQELDDVLHVIAEWADLQSPWAMGHATTVAALVTAAGQRYGLPRTDIAVLRRAALVHDIGMVGISPSVRTKPGPLSDDERERVRLHTYDAERIFARSHALAPIGALAALHHERLDGSGYYRGLYAPQLSPAARILSAADVYQSLIEPRPYRSAIAPTVAAEMLHREAREGWLDSGAVRAVLAAAGHAMSGVRRTSIGGLSPRETEVLRLLAPGCSNRQMAEQLVISERTVDHHIRHIYDKIEVSTRAAAALFAMQHHLLDPLERAFCSDPEKI